MAFSHSFSCLLIFVIGFVFRSSNNDLRMMRYSSKTLIVLINIYMFINAISLHFVPFRQDLVHFAVLIHNSNW